MNLETVDPELAPHCRELLFFPHPLEAMGYSKAMLACQSCSCWVLWKLSYMQFWREGGLAKKELCFLCSGKLFHQHEVETLLCVAQTDFVQESLRNCCLSCRQQLIVPMTVSKSWSSTSFQQLNPFLKDKRFPHTQKSQAPAGKAWSYQSFWMEDSGE